MSGTFAQNRLFELPPHMQGPEGQAVASACGEAQDAELALLRIAALSRFPALCPNDALDGLGEWFVIERFAGEPDDTYRARLEQAFPTWEEAGSDQAIIDSFAAYGIPEVAILHDFEGYFHDGANFARFDIFILPNTTVLPFHLGAGLGVTNGPFAPQTMPFVTVDAGGDSTTLGSSATISQVVAVKRQVLKWKGAHGYPVAIVLVWSDSIVMNGGVPLTMPFVTGSSTCVWHLGKLTGPGENIQSMPFTAGGYDV